MTRTLQFNLLLVSFLKAFGSAVTFLFLSSDQANQTLLLLRSPSHSLSVDKPFTKALLLVSQMNRL